jgi:chromosome segregation ATPase
MRRIDIFVSSPEDVQKERSLVERTIRAVADEFSVPITVTYSNWLREHIPLDKIAVPSANGSEDGRTWLCPCFWEYRDTELDQEYREQIPNTGSYDLVISIIWSRLGTRLSPAFVMPDGSQPKAASEYEIGWVLDQVNRTPGFPELRVYRNGAVPSAPLQPKTQREAFFRDWDAVQEFFTVWEKQKTFTEACSRYSDLQEFENLFRTHFRDFLTRQLEKEIVPRKPVLRVNRNKAEPFRGLRFFNFEHAPIFHGRTKAVGQVLDALGKQANANTPFVLVLGPSGSGKSSLVRAGVLPLLTEIGMAGEGPWRYAITRPGSGSDPFDSLAAALLENTALPELKRAKKRENGRELVADLKETPAKVALEIAEMIDRISVQELDHLLDREKGQIPVPGRIESAELARHRRLRRVKPKAQIALFIDQLEDLFTNDFSPELQHQYFAALTALVRCERVYVIAALGSDYYAAYQEFPELVALTNPSGRFDLQSPTREEFGRMVRAPAETYGLRFDRQAKTGQALDDALIEAALASADQLPLLEHVLWLLYRKQAARDDGLLRWSDYLELGELEGALAHHAEKVFTTLSSEAWQAFDFVLRRLAPVELDQKGSCRTALYRDLVASGGIDSRLQGGAKDLLDSMVKEGLFISETDFRKQEVVSVAHPALLRKWPRVREWLIEDQEFLRMRDRLDGCLKLWLKRGRRRRDLLTPGLGLADGETLLNHFHSSLSNPQIEYIQKSLADQKRGRRVRYLFWLPFVVVLVSVAAFFEFRWFNNESLRTNMREFGSVERKFAELAKADRGGSQAELGQAEERAQVAQHDAELAAAQRSAMESQLKQAQENASLAQERQSAFEIQLKQAQDKLQLAGQNADLVSNQRAALEAQLKQAQDKLQQAGQNADLVSNQRAALESQLKQAQDKLQQAGQNADQASNQRAALESQLKQAQDKLQQASQNADQVSNQRAALDAQLKQVQDKLQQASQDADQASNQRAALEGQLKQAQDKVQQASQKADLVSNQRATLESQLKQAQDKLQQASQKADLVSNQRAALEGQLKQAQDKLRQAQKNADLASSLRSALETQLKQAQDKLQQAQQNADLASNQRAALETQSKQTQDKLQQAQKNVDLVSSQHTALETQLKQAQDKLQQAQQGVDLVSSQRAALETQLKQTQDKLQQVAEPASNQRAALEAQLKQAQDKLQQAQQSADLASSQRAALETQLKQAQDKLQQVAEPASNQRAALEAQLKQAQDKLQQAQQSADLASSQRAALQSQLEQAQAGLQQAQQSADLASGQRIAVETQAKQTQDKLQQAQQNADRASSQRAALETQLKQAEDKLQQASQNADLVSNQRAALEAQLKESQDKLQQTQKDADLVSSQRSAVETQLKESQDKLQQAQKNADLASSQRFAVETQLKDAREKLKQAQNGADLASNQRAALESQLKDVQGKLQNAELASNQRSTLETQLKQAQDKLQHAQQNADQASNQNAALETQLKEAQDKLQQAQQNADLALSQRAALATQLREAEQKAQLAQKIADLVAAQAHPEQNEASKEGAVRKNGRSPNQPGSGRALPLDAGRNPEPGTSTQPLIAPVQSAGH